MEIGLCDLYLMQAKRGISTVDDQSPGEPDGQGCCMWVRIFLVRSSDVCFRVKERHYHKRSQVFVLIPRGHTRKKVSNFVLNLPQGRHYKRSSNFLRRVNVLEEYEGVRLCVWQDRSSSMTCLTLVESLHWGTETQGSK